MDWSDLRDIDSFGDIAPSSSKKDTEEKPSESNENQEQTENEAEATEYAADYEVTDWNDMKKFDDDHDDDWFKAEEKKLAGLYGGNFLKVKYTNNGRVAYFCEICLAECNAKKSLELHCSGMKHLKKKDLWEKEGKPPPQVTLSSLENAPKPSNFYQGNNYRGDGRDKRSSPRRLLHDARRSRRDRSRSRERSYSYDSYDRHRDEYNVERDRGSGDRFFRDDYSNAPFERDSFMPTKDYRDRGRYPPKEPENRYDSFAPSVYGYSRERRDDDSYERKTRSPVRPRYYGDDVPGRSSYRNSPNGGRSPPSPPKFIANPVVVEPVEIKQSLATSPAGCLLQKLAECCVKSSDDADLALNVVVSLTKSLKEYSQKQGEKKIAELLMEAELKVGTVKALKVGMKMMSNFAASSKDTSIDYLKVFEQTQMENNFTPSFANAPVGYPNMQNYFKE